MGNLSGIASLPSTKHDNDSEFEQSVRTSMTNCNMHFCMDDMVGTIGHMISGYLMTEIL